MADEPDTGVEIDGDTYPLPRLEEITLDEERILYLYADTVLQDFAPARPEADDSERAQVEREQLLKIRNPDFKRALVHIAYRRAHPDIADKDIQALIGDANALAVDVELVRGDADGPPAPTSPNAPAKPKGSRTPTKQPDSGTPTGNGSDQADETPDATGTTGSPTSSQPSPATESVN